MLTLTHQLGGVVPLVRDGHGVVVRRPQVVDLRHDRDQAELPARPGFKENIARLRESIFVDCAEISNL